MACEITIKDIERDIRKAFLNSSLIENPSVEGSSIFVPYTKENEGKLRKTLSKISTGLNDKYYSEDFGDVVSFSRENEFGYVVHINPSQKLANAMTQDLIEQDAEARVFNERLNGADEFIQDESDFHYSPRDINNQNTKRPITDNFIEYKRYKETQLNKVREEIKQLHRDRKNPSKDMNLTLERLAKLSNIEAELRKDLEFIESNKSELLFETLSRDIDELSQAIAQNRDIETIKEKLNFLNLIVKGIDFDGKEQSGIVSIQKFGNPEFERINLAVDNLNTAYREKIGDLRDSLIRGDILFYNNVETNSELTEDDIKSMFNPTTDINWATQTFIGITASSANDGIIPQVIKSYLETKTTLRKAEVKKYTDRLKDLMAQMPDEDFSFIFETTESGNKTGNIINLYTEKFSRELNKYFGIDNDDTKNASQKHIEKVKWLKENTVVIDFRKLRVVKDLYGDIHSEYFTFDDAMLDSYEKEMRDLLGPLYEEEVSKVLRNLENFQLEQDSLLADVNNKYRFANVARVNPWAFVKQYYTPGEAYQHINFKAGGINTESVIPVITNIRFVPAKTKYIHTNLKGQDKFVDTKYYNDKFVSEISPDPTKLEYWKLMKEIYTDYINPVYGPSGTSDMSYAKMERDLVETITTTQGLQKGTALLKTSAREFKKFFYEQGFDNTREGIQKDYTDKAKKEVGQLASVYRMLTPEALQAKAKEAGITTDLNHRELAREIALKEVMPTYSEDINKVTEALLHMAASIKAKQDTASVASLLKDAHKLSGPERARSIERLDSWVDRVIFNQNEKYRGSASFLGKDLVKDTLLGKVLDKLGEIPFLKRYLNSKMMSLLTDSEKKIMKELVDIKSQGPSKADTHFKVGDVTYVQSKEVTYVVLEDGILNEIPEQQFDDAFQMHISQRIEELGLDLSAAGIIQGILKTIILKGLALNPISGIFNRIEGKNSGLIMDQTGQYWTKGNLPTANNFMAFANFLNMLPERFTPEQLEKVQELSKMKILLQNIDLIQNRKNELERASTSSKFDYDEALNPYKWAVDNPEFKNQGAILLAILMDTKVQDIHGNEVAIFSGSEFNIWDEVGGKLVLKPEYRTESNILNWENFDINEIDITDNQYHLTRQKIKTAISSSQGNYDNLDVIYATKHIWGRSLTLFMKWMPEHARQRFSSGKGFDLATGKQQIKGRYRYLWENSPAALTAGVLSATVAFGFTPATALIGLGWTGLIATKYIRNMYGKNAVKNEAINTLEFIAFAKTVVISTLNYPLQLVNSKYAIEDTALDNIVPGYSQTNLSQEEINNLQAVAKELAIKLTFLSMMILAKAALWDDDDDKESEQRQFHNFIDNQFTRVISSLDNWTNPEALSTDIQRFAFLQYLWSVSKLVKSILANEEGKKIKDNAFKASPIPRLLYKGSMPWYDEKEYESQDWYDKWIRESGKKGDFKKYQDGEKARIKKELEAQELSPEQFEKRYKSRVRQEIATKGKGQTYEEVLGDLKDGKTGRQLNKEKRKKQDKKAKENN